MNSLSEIVLTHHRLYMALQEALKEFEWHRIFHIILIDVDGKILQLMPKGFGIKPNSIIDTSMVRDHFSGFRPVIRAVYSFV